MIDCCPELGIDLYIIQFGITCIYFDPKERVTLFQRQLPLLRAHLNFSRLRLAEPTDMEDLRRKRSGILTELAAWNVAFDGRYNVTFGQRLASLFPTHTNSSKLPSFLLHTRK